MATETSFESMLDEDIAIRMRFLWDVGQIVEFVVQLELFVDNHWYPVVRYDTAHGFAHRDILRPTGSQEKQPLGITDYQEAMMYADVDIRMRYVEYCNRFKEWLNE
jgi:hypothetical protein